MNGSRIIEVSYASGEEYKFSRINNNGNSSVISERHSDNCVSEYYDDANTKFLDKNYPTFSVKRYSDGETDLKYYYPSTEVYKLVKGDKSEGGMDLSVYDLCPDILFVGAGLYKNNSSYDLIFSVENDEQLKKISDYYELDYPLPVGMSLNSTSTEWNSISMRSFCKNISNNDGVSINFDDSYIKNFKYGSIKFKNGTPQVLKMYKSNYKG